MSGFWGDQKFAFPLLYCVAMSVFGHPPSSAGMEKDFGTAALVMPQNRNCLDARYFLAQLVCLANMAHLPTLCEMPIEKMTQAAVMLQCPRLVSGPPLWMMGRQRGLRHSSTILTIMDIRTMCGLCACRGSEFLSDFCVYGYGWFLLWFSCLLSSLLFHTNMLLHSV